MNCPDCNGSSISKVPYHECRECGARFDEPINDPAPEGWEITARKGDIVRTFFRRRGEDAAELKQVLIEAGFDNIVTGPAA